MLIILTLVLRLNSPDFLEDPDLHSMAHEMRESLDARHTLIVAVTLVNVPPPCSILYEDWEPYYTEDPDLKDLLHWGIEKNVEYGTYRWHEQQWGHPHLRLVGRAVVSLAILSKVQEPVHYIPHRGSSKTLQIFKRQFHVCHLSNDDLRDRVKEVVNACVVCAESKA